MALCTSCGSQVDDSASFCTSCGKPMPAAAHPSAAIMATRPVCSFCGAQADPGSVFCTECGKRLDAEPAPVVEDAHAVMATVPPATETVPPSLNTFCTNCGTKIDPGTGFCTNCGQPAVSSSAAASEPATNFAPMTPAVEATQLVGVEPIIATSASTELIKDAILTEPVSTTPPPSRVESTPIATAESPLVEDRQVVAVPVKPAPVQPAPQVAAPIYATPSDYPPAQPGGGAFRAVVLILLLLILIGGLGGWYFMGVETVIVCSPPDVTVYLDNKELAPTSYGRYVIPHLSRQPHLLKVQRPGFADMIERLDFSMTSLHEWVNIKLVPRRQTRPLR